MVVAETLAKLLTSNSLDLKRKKHPMEQPHFLRLHYCSLKDSGYEQNKNVVWSQGFFFSHFKSIEWDVSKSAFDYP